MVRLVLAACVLTAWGCVDTGPTRRPESNRAPLGWVDVRLDVDGEVTLGADGPWWASTLDGADRVRGSRLPPDTPLIIAVWSSKVVGWPSTTKPVALSSRSTPRPNAAARAPPPERVTAIITGCAAGGAAWAAASEPGSFEFTQGR